jgi:SAM-dependent methyltransferase
MNLDQDGEPSCQTCGRRSTNWIPKRRNASPACSKLAAPTRRPFHADSFDVVVFDSVLCHVPGPEHALTEAARVLAPDGWLAAFDGDYATTTAALTDHDPLQACVDAMVANSVTDQWLARRLPRLLNNAGFEQVTLRGHSFVETENVTYMLTIIDRGADILCAAGHITPSTAEALKAEARRRDQSGTFFGHIGYVSAVAHRPAT